VTAIATLEEPDEAVQVTAVLEIQTNAWQGVLPNEGVAPAAELVEPKFMPSTVTVPPPVAAELPRPNVTIGES